MSEKQLTRISAAAEPKAVSASPSPPAVQATAPVLKGIARPRQGAIRTRRTVCNVACTTAAASDSPPAKRPRRAPALPSLGQAAFTKLFARPCAVGDTVRHMGRKLHLLSTAP